MPGPDTVAVTASSGEKADAEKAKHPGEMVVVTQGVNHASVMGMLNTRKRHKSLPVKPRP